MMYIFTMPDLSPPALRRLILEQSNRAHVGHIGSSLSIAELIAVLFSGVMKLDDTADRDRFVLSKGHAALALYAALFLKGTITERELKSYCAQDFALGVHPEHIVPGIDFSTGSLGMGLSFGTGAALAARFQKSDRRVFVLVSDAECDEGALWEAVMFAAHHKLANLVVLVDFNRQQAFGYTKDVLDLSPVGERWRAFGWDVHEVDGHNPELLTKTLASLNTKSGQPHVIVAQTVFGKGVSYMEGQIKWHYWPMSEEEFKTAMAEVESQGA